MPIRTAGQSKGIFCIEGNWVKDLRMPQTVRPLLNLLLFNANIPYIHRHGCLYKKSHGCHVHHCTIVSMGATFRTWVSRFTL